VSHERKKNNKTKPSKMKKKVLFLDSRDRDYTLYPGCQDVGFVLSEKFRDVRKISLLSFVMWFPPYPGGNQMNNIMLLLDGIRGNSSIELPAQMPDPPPGSSVLAILQGLNTAIIGLDPQSYYQASTKFVPWTIEFPGGMNLRNLRFRLCYYDRSLVPAAGPGSILPIDGYSWFAEQNEFSKESNWHCQVCVEYNEVPDSV
jgi:hypothetical protein